MSTKFALFLSLICALIALSVASVQIDTGANAIPVFQEAPKIVGNSAESARATATATVADAVSEAPVIDATATAENTIENILKPDQWPTQLFKPLKEAETKENPIEVIIPIHTPVKPPMKFRNRIKFSDFNISDFPIGVDHRVQYYQGAYSTAENTSSILPTLTIVKQAITGFENILYQEAQIMQALSGKPYFPQLINYDGRNLTMSALCASWTQYTAIEFQSGGMDLKNGYSMMLQMFDALKELHSLGYVHRDVSANNIAFGCYYGKDLVTMDAPFKLTETSKLYLQDFGATENVVESILNKYYLFAGTWDFVSNATLHDEEPMFVQDAESLGYVLIYGLNGGILSWSSTQWSTTDGNVILKDNIAKKTALDLDENLARMKGDEKTIAKAKRDITKYFTLIRQHTLQNPKDLLDYEALKACFNINEE